ncbi:hypothetical protein WR25_23452 [Diploscapter pachys]|uniref:Uncharacterized protein n=1 Tax=Diploscapter pachys TaxID=2018661 RepID=A0A2A2KQC7_9BILA|nr:hypothetical protein WR25_23452 [Diploscapter pachys]
MMNLAIFLLLVKCSNACVPTVPDIELPDVSTTTGTDTTVSTPSMTTAITTYMTSDWTSSTITSSLSTSTITSSLSTSTITTSSTTTGHVSDPVACPSCTQVITDETYWNGPEPVDLCADIETYLEANHGPPTITPVPSDPCTETIISAHDTFFVRIEFSIKGVVPKKSTLKFRANILSLGVFDHSDDESDDPLNEVQQKWMSGEISVAVATIAFGMGIDKANAKKGLNDDVKDIQIKALQTEFEKMIEYCEKQRQESLYSRSQRQNGETRESFGYEPKQKKEEEEYSGFENGKEEAVRLKTAVQRREMIVRTVIQDLDDNSPQAGNQLTLNATPAICNPRHSAPTTTRLHSLECNQERDKEWNGIRFLFCFSHLTTMKQCIGILNKGFIDFIL